MRNFAKFIRHLKNNFQVVIYFLAGVKMSRMTWATGEGGKDIVMVAARSELEAPSKAVLPEPEPAPGLLMPDGSINWGCPCLGGMATGPCGTQFRDAFSCFHYR